MLPYGEKNLSACVLAHAGMLFDALSSITCLVIGILGATSIIIMPPSAAYALIGISGGITALWITMVILENCCTPCRICDEKGD